MLFTEKKGSTREFPLREREVYITGGRDSLLGLGLAAKVDMNVPLQFAVIDDQLESQKYPCMDNKRLQTGDKIVLIAEKTMEHPMDDWMGLRLRLPGPYEFGGSSSSWGGHVILDAAVETDRIRNNDMAAFLPNLRARGFCDDDRVFDVAEVVKRFGVPITVLSFDVNRYFTEQQEGKKEPTYMDEEFRFEWAFRDEEFIGLNFYRDIHSFLGKVEKIGTDNERPALLPKGAGRVYLTTGGFTGAENKSTSCSIDYYTKAVTGLAGYKDEKAPAGVVDTLLAAPFEEIKRVSKDHMVSQLTKRLVPGAIRTVSFRGYE